MNRVIIGYTGGSMKKTFMYTSAHRDSAVYIGEKNFIVKVN